MQVFCKISQLFEGLLEAVQSETSDQGEIKSPTMFSNRAEKSLRSSGPASESDYLTSLDRKRVMQLFSQNYDLKTRFQKNRLELNAI